MSVKSSLDSENKQEQQTPEKPVEKPVEAKAEVETGNDSDKIAKLEETINDMAEHMRKMDYRISEKNPEERVRVRGVEQLDPKDVMKDPQVFFCFVSSYEMYGYTKNGVEILTPYGRPIRFTFHTRYERPSRSGKGMDSICVSKVVLHSKLEVSWVKSHPDFGIKVYDNASKIGSVDITQHQKMSEFAAQIANLDDHQVIVRATASQLTIIEDIPLLRKQLITKLTEDEVALSKKRIEAEVQEMADIRSKKKEMQSPQSAPATAPVV